MLTLRYLAAWPLSTREITDADTLNSSAILLSVVRGFFAMRQVYATAGVFAQPFTENHDQSCGLSHNGAQSRVQKFRLLRPVVEDDQFQGSCSLGRCQKDCQ